MVRVLCRISFLYEELYDNHCYQKYYYLLFLPSYAMKENEIVRRGIGKTLRRANIL